MELNKAPLIIGGSGGSGTRAVTKVFMEAGYYMGSELQVNSFDDLPIARFFNKWTRIYLIDNCIHEIMRKGFEKFLDDHTKELDKNKKWGWKEPRTVFFIPLIYSYFPDMKFIHVIRDGRDMAYSKNYRQQKELFDVFFDVKWFPQFCFEAAVMFWAKTNIRTKKMGLKILKDSYLCIKLEDLCFNTNKTIQKMVDFMGLSGINMEDLVDCIEIPKSIGRWKSDPKWADKLHNLALVGLKEFGYDI